MLNFHFEAVHEEIPAKPPDEQWTRRGKTTQVMIRISERPDNAFRLWLPEKSALSGTTETRMLPTRTSKRAKTTA